jgi:methionyl aminopeptidase
MISRNDPCWCGSGKKYKKCHLHRDEMKSGKSSKAVYANRMVKSSQEIEGMRKAGAFNGELMDYIRPHVKAGISTEEIDSLVRDYTIKHGHVPASLGYHNFPKSVCISLNDVVCHGIPSPEIRLKKGDIVNIDLTTIVDGFHGDSSETFIIGEVSEEACRLVTVAAESMLKGIEAVGPGRHLRSIANAIQPYVESRGFSVVRQYTGHGTGRKFHENFTVCHHITPDCEDITFLPGMTFTIEPMINSGSYKVITDSLDRWTVRTKDGSLSAQFEHTLLITETGVDVLTRTPSQIAAGVVINLPLQE